jgi:hypothetical protein
MIKALATLVFITSFALVASAQEEIEPDRPTESQSVALVGKKHISLEAGFRKIFNDETDRAVQLPNVLLRYGLLDRLELRLEATREHLSQPGANEYHTGIKPLEIGLKASLFHNKDSSFMASLFGQYGMHGTATKAFSEGADYHRVRLLFENELSKRLKVSYNVGRDWDSDEQHQNWIYTLSPEYMLSPKWTLFAEAYSTVEEHHHAQWYSDAGVSYSLGNQIRLDFDAGKGLSPTAANYFITTGFSVRF